MNHLPDITDLSPFPVEFKGDPVLIKEFIRLYPNAIRHILEELNETFHRIIHLPQQQGNLIFELKADKITITHCKPKTPSQALNFHHALYEFYKTNCEAEPEIIHRKSLIQKGFKKNLIDEVHRLIKEI